MQRRITYSWLLCATLLTYTLKMVIAFQRDTVELKKTRNARQRMCKAVRKGAIILKTMMTQCTYTYKMADELAAQKDRYSCKKKKKNEWSTSTNAVYKKMRENNTCSNSLVNTFYKIVITRWIQMSAKVVEPFEASSG